MVTQQSLVSLDSLSESQQQQLAELLDQYVAAVGRGESPDISFIAQQHPALAEQFQLLAGGLAELHLQLTNGNNPNVSRPNNDFGNAQSEPQRSSALPAEHILRGTLGDYELLREIGRGGMGIVYEARQISLERTVALKVLPFAAVLDQKQIARFHHEAQAAAQLHHPNIVPVFGVGNSRGVHFFSMQLVDGQSLDQAIEDWRKKRKPPITNAPSGDTLRAGFSSTLPVETSRFCIAIARLLIPAIDAVQYAHDNGVLHRDLKPSNLLVDRDGHVWVTDFGLARIRSDAKLTASGDILGTLRYMSPEQASGHAAQVDERSDVYSLGATLYELLTLQPAFTGDADGHVLRRIAEEEPKPPRSLNPAIPADIETIVLKALSKQRETRYGSARELADDLRRYVNQQPIHARRPTLTDRMYKLVKRHQRLSAATALTLVVAFIGVLIANWKISEANERTQAALQQVSNERDRSNENFSDGRRAVDFLSTQIATRVAELPGGHELAIEALESALPYYQEFRKRSPDDATLRREEALAQLKLAPLQIRIGSTEKAQALLAAARDTLADLLRETPNDVHLQHATARCDRYSAELACNQFDFVQTQRYLNSTLKTLEGLLKFPQDPRLVHRELAATYYAYGKMHQLQGQREAASGLFQLAERSALAVVQLNQNLGRDELDDMCAVDIYRSEWATSVVCMPNRPNQPEIVAELEVQITQPVERLEKLAKLFPRSVFCKEALAVCLINHATFLREQKKYEAALTANRLAVAVALDTYRIGPTVVHYQNRYLAALLELGFAELAQANFDAAEQAFQATSNACYEIDRQVAERTGLPFDPDTKLPPPSTNPLQLDAKARALFGMAEIRLHRKELNSASIVSGTAASIHQTLHYQRFPNLPTFTERLDQDLVLQMHIERQRCQHPESTNSMLSFADARKQLYAKEPARYIRIAADLALVGAESPADSPARTILFNAALKTLHEAQQAGYRLTTADISHEAFKPLNDTPEFRQLTSKSE